MRLGDKRPGWSGLSLAFKVELLIAFLLLVAVLATAVLSIGARQLNATLSLADRDRRELTLLNTLEIAALNVESGGRGYTLTHDARFLEQYRDGMDRIGGALPELRQITSFPYAVDDIGAAIKQYLNEDLRPAIERTRNNALVSPGDQEAANRRGREHFDALRAKLTALRQQLESMNAASRDASDLAARAVQWLPWASLTMLALALFGLRSALRRTITAPLTRMRDATERLAAGDYNARVQVESNDEVGQLAASFNEAAASLDALTRSLRERADEAHAHAQNVTRFLYTVSHDLKTPIVSIRGLLGVLNEDHGATLDADAAAILQRVDRNAAHAANLLDDLLEYGRVTRNEAAPEEFNLGDAVRDAIAALGPAWHVARLALPDAWPDVIAPREGVQLAVQNMLSNAAKFARPDVPPEVDVTWRRDDGRVWLDVADNGRGLAPEHAARAFEMFWRLDPKTEGSGIGLTVVKSVAERAGGDVAVHERPGGGSVFSIALPSAGAQQSAP